MTLKGRATPDATTAYVKRLNTQTAEGHFRSTPDGLLMSSIGLGTYLGKAED